jgi:hypothetical protein
MHKPASELVRCHSAVSCAPKMKDVISKNGHTFSK